MKGMILAAGIGSRLGTITQDRPKCLAEAGGRVMLEHVIKQLKEYGITEVSINLFHMAEMVRNFLQQKSFFGLTMEMFEEEVLLGTGGGINNMRAFIGSDDYFLVHNCDVYSTINLRAVEVQHRHSHALATLVIQRHESSRPLNFDAKGLLIPSIEALGDVSYSLPPGVQKLAFTGVHILSRRIFDYMPQKRESFSIISTYMQAARAGEKIASFDATDDFWIDIGRPERLKQLDDILRSRP
jgi:NDP-sugar pyrophosphorylase family protein